MNSPVKKFPTITQYLKDKRFRKVRFNDLCFAIERQGFWTEKTIKNIIKGMERHGFIKQCVDKLGHYWILCGNKKFHFENNRKIDSEEKQINKMIKELT